MVHRAARRGSSLARATLFLAVAIAAVNAGIFPSFCKFIQVVPSSDEDTPSKRYGHSLVEYRSKIVLFGGYDGTFSNNFMSDTWKWDFSPYATENIADQAAITSAAAVEGAAAVDESDSVGFKFDAGKWRIVKVAHKPPGRYGHVAVTLAARHEMVLFGGNGGNIDLQDDLWVLDLRKETWREVPKSSNASVPWPSPRTGASGTMVDGALFMFGGWSSSGGASAELWKLSASGATWSWDLLHQTTPSIKGPAGRFDHVSVPVSVDLMVYGGQDGAGNYLSDLWRFDTQTKSWGTAIVGSGAPAARSRAMAVPFAGGMMLWGGYSRTNGYFSDMWRFANPPGTRIVTTANKTSTLTQTVSTSCSITTVQDRTPVWEPMDVEGGEWDYGSNGSASGVQRTWGEEEGQQAAEQRARGLNNLPAPRAYASAVYLTMASGEPDSTGETLVNQGLIMHGGESENLLHGDMWMLQCGQEHTNRMTFLVICIVVVTLGTAISIYRCYHHYHHRRLVMARVSAVLTHSMNHARKGRNLREHVVYDGLRIRKIASLVKDVDAAIRKSEVKTGRNTGRTRALTGISTIKAFKVVKDSEDSAEGPRGGSAGSSRSKISWSRGSDKGGLSREASRS